MLVVLGTNSGGNLRRITLPLMPVEHHYFVTDPVPELENLRFELPLIGDADSEYYMRQEGRGLLLGVVELREAVRELAPADEELEAIRHERIGVVAARKRRHLGRVLAASELRVRHYSPTPMITLGAKS